MTSFPALDIAIGLSFVYLLLSLIVTTVNEMIAALLQKRAKFLEEGVSQLLMDPEIQKAIYQHPLIKSLSNDKKVLRPSYIPADKFATALMDVVTGRDNPTMSVDALRSGAAKATPEFQQAIEALADVSGHDPRVLKQKIEDWFNDGMDRVSGWYKRNAQKNTLILAVIVTLAVNADTLHVVNTLWRDPSIRATLVEQAKARTASQETNPIPMVEYPDPNDPTASKPIAVPGDVLTDAEKQSLNQLTGWTTEWTRWKESGSSFASWVGQLLTEHLLGWILTAIALSLGAPFWFDTLNRFMNMRNAGRTPERGQTTTTAQAQAQAASAAQQ